MNIKNTIDCYKTIFFSSKIISGDEELKKRISSLLSKLFPNGNGIQSIALDDNGNPIILPDYLNTNEDKICFLIFSNRFEVSFYRKSNDLDDFDFNKLYENAKKIIEILMTNEMIPINRLAINIDRVVSGIATKAVKNFGHYFSNTIKSFENIELNEWSTRVVKSQEILLNNKNDELNVIYSVSNGQKLSTYEDVILYQIDINTTHLNMLPRFKKEEIYDFLDKASEIGSKTDDEISAKIAGNKHE